MIFLLVETFSEANTLDVGFISSLSNVFSAYQEESKIKWRVERKEMNRVELRTILIQLLCALEWQVSPRFNPMTSISHLTPYDDIFSFEKDSWQQSKLSKEGCKLSVKLRESAVTKTKVVTTAYQSKENTFKSQWGLKVKTTKLTKARGYVRWSSRDRFWFCISLVERGASFLNQSQSEVEENQCNLGITFENKFKLP